MNEGYAQFSAIKQQLSALVNRLSPSPGNALNEVIASLIDAWQANHSHIVLDDAQLAMITSPSLATLVGGAKADTPLVLQNNRMYFRRLLNLETRVALALQQRNQPLPRTNPAANSALTAKSMTPASLSASQAKAVSLSLTRQLAIITGGPGTGKTRIIKQIVDQAIAVEPSIRIAITAPTGKATARLETQFTDKRAGLELKTIHRLLGFGHRGTPRYHRDHPLDIDLVVVDETSMVDLALADALLAALPAHCRLILVGDPAQLPSVNLGRLLADLSILPSETEGDPLPETFLKGSRVTLTENFRFGEGTGIDVFASDLPTSMPFETNDGAAIRTIQPETLSEADFEDLFRPYLSALSAKATPKALLHAFNQSRILAPQYLGALGVHDVNHRVEALLTRSGLITRTRPDFYHGRPVLIVDNHYHLGLFNGDVGICLDPAQIEPSETLPLTQTGGLRVYFSQPEGDSTRSLPITALPRHETCFAMTVHKSQGSEFDHVFFILPETLEGTSNTLQSRELVYTAVTRARQQLTIVTTPSIWHNAVQRVYQRRSSLPEQLKIIELTS